MLGVCNRAWKVNVRHGVGSQLSTGNFIVNSSFKGFHSITSCTATTVLRKFSLDTEVLYIWNKDHILGLCWLTENGCLLDTQDCCLQNPISGLLFHVLLDGFLQSLLWICISNCLSMVRSCRSLMPAQDCLVALHAVHPNRQ